MSRRLLTKVLVAIVVSVAPTPARALGLLVSSSGGVEVPPELASGYRVLVARTARGEADKDIELLNNEYEAIVQQIAIGSWFPTLRSDNQADAHGVDDWLVVEATSLRSFYCEVVRGDSPGEEADHTTVGCKALPLPNDAYRGLPPVLVGPLIALELSSTAGLSIAPRCENRVCRGYHFAFLRSHGAALVRSWNHLATLSAAEHRRELAPWMLDALILGQVPLPLDAMRTSAALRTTCQPGSAMLYHESVDNWTLQCNRVGTGVHLEIQLSRDELNLVELPPECTGIVFEEPSAEAGVLLGSGGTSVGPQVLYYGTPPTEIPLARETRSCRRGRFGYSLVRRPEVRMPEVSASRDALPTPVVCLGDRAGALFDRTEQLEFRADGALAERRITLVTAFIPFELQINSDVWEASCSVEGEARRSLQQSAVCPYNFAGEWHEILRIILPVARCQAP